MSEAAAPLPGPGGTNSSPSYVPLNTWSFHDPTNWTSDTGTAPVSFTNLASSYLGNGSSLVLDTNIQAWLQFNVVETNSATNLTVDSGAIEFWFAPASWSSTSAGGNGPGQYAQLITVGNYTSDSSYGWFCVYASPDGNTLYFSAQTNDLSGTVTTYWSYPISWTTNYFHQVIVNYSSTNTALILDGSLVTNGAGMTVYPGPDVLANGFFIGSDSNGLSQAHGLFNNLKTYNVPVDSGASLQSFSSAFAYYQMNPANRAMFSLTNAVSYPTWTNGFDAITGVGNLQLVGSGSCNYSTNANQVWITNVTAIATNGGTSVTFTISGGQPGCYYDVFATGAMQAPLTNSICVWLGQGQTCNTYTISIVSQNTFFVLGTPQSTSASGLTDAYLNLVAKVSPSGSQYDSYGVPYAWYAANGLVPIISGLAAQDPDSDGLLNYQEYLYGTKPNVSEGFSVWTSLNGTTVIP